MATQDKYDRQLRLWGSHGQRKLGNCNVCLLNASATGSEILKNLVLPGVGSITIVDDSVVTAEDLQENFFLTQDSLGESKAIAVCDLLLEMNADVTGSALNLNVEILVQTEPTFFAKFGLIIATQLDEKTALTLSKACEVCSTPLLIVRSFGLIGHLRICAREHRVIESKPDPAPVADLRICNPWPELLQFVHDTNTDEMDEKDFQHTPFVLILIKQLEKWRLAHDGKLPSNSAEKEEFKKGIKSLARQEWGKEENLTEATTYAYLSFSARQTTPDVGEVLNDAELNNVNANTPNFWVLCKALKEFMEHEGGGLLPLSGSLPDFTSSTQMYVALQQLYKEKATKDREAVSKRIDAILKAIGRPITSVNAEERELFCKFANDLRLFRFRSLEQELHALNTESFTMAIMMEPSPQNPAYWYLALRAADAFRNLHQRYPGEGSSRATDKTDSAALLEIAKKQFPDFDITLDHCKEITRFGGMKRELHSIAAIMGGIGSQEAIKIITHQYSPVNNTFVYNGISCLGGTFEA